MQVSSAPEVRRPPRNAGLDSLAGRFEEHWNDLLRFILNRRMYRGPAGNLSHIELGAVRALAERDLRMSEVAAQLGLPESTTTRLVDRLQAAGLVRRRSSSPDRRCVVAGLTPAGRRLMERVREERRDFLKDVLETLPQRERAELVHLFGRVADELRARGTIEVRS
jgi:DNA-binding MarR family transcriptional regulator